MSSLTPSVGNTYYKEYSFKGLPGLQRVIVQR